MKEQLLEHYKIILSNLKNLPKSIYRDKRIKDIENRIRLINSVEE